MAKRIRSARRHFSRTSRLGATVKSTSSTRTIFENKGARLAQRPRQTANKLPGIDRTAKDFFPDSQFARVAPANRRVGLVSCGRAPTRPEAPNRKRHSRSRRIQRPRPEHRQGPADHPRSRFGQASPPVWPLGASTDSRGLEYGDSLVGVEALQIRGGGEAAEAISPTIATLTRLGKV